MSELIMKRLKKQGYKKLSNSAFINKKTKIVYEILNGYNEVIKTTPVIVKTKDNQTLTITFRTFRRMLRANEHNQ